MFSQGLESKQRVLGPLGSSKEVATAEDGKIDFDEFFQMIRGVENSSQSPTGSGPSIKPGGRDSPTHKQKEEQRLKMSSASVANFEKVEKC